MTTRRYTLFAGALLWCLTVTTVGTAGELSDDALSNISAKGDVNTGGGSLSTSCATPSSGVCTGVFSWTDSHAYDSSQYKGAIHQDGYVQQNLSANVNVDATESAIATGANVVGDITSSTGTSITLSNNQNAVGYIGGF